MRATDSKDTTTGPWSELVGERIDLVPSVGLVYFTPKIHWSGLTGTGFTTSFQAVLIGERLE